MILNEAHEIRLGDDQVEAVYLGDELIWVMDERQLSISPDTIWLVDENDNEVVDVTSNTKWNVY